MNVRRILAAVLFFTALVVVGAGSVAVAASSERQVTEATLQELEHDDAHKSLTADAVKQARAAIERATRMRAAGDRPDRALWACAALATVNAKSSVLAPALAQGGHHRTAGQ